MQTLDGNRRGNASGKGALLFYQLLISQGNPNPFANERKKMTKTRIGDADFLASAAEKSNFTRAKSGQSTGNSKTVR